MWCAKVWDLPSLVGCVFGLCLFGASCAATVAEYRRLDPRTGNVFGDIGCLLSACVCVDVPFWYGSRRVYVHCGLGLRLCTCPVLTMVLSIGG